MHDTLVWLLDRYYRALVTLAFKPLSSSTGRLLFGTPGPHGTGSDDAGGVGASIREALGDRSAVTSNTDHRDEAVDLPPLRTDTLVSVDTIVQYDDGRALPEILSTFAQESFA